MIQYNSAGSVQKLSSRMCQKILLMIFIGVSVVRAQNNCLPSNESTRLCANYKACETLKSIPINYPLLGDALMTLLQSQCGQDGNEQKVCCQQTVSDGIPNPVSFSINNLSDAGNLLSSINSSSSSGATSQFNFFNGAPSSININIYFLNPHSSQSGVEYNTSSNNFSNQYSSNNSLSNQDSLMTNLLNQDSLQNNSTVLDNNSMNILNKSPSNSSSLREGSYCTNPNDVLGLCVAIKECAPLVDIVRKKSLPESEVSFLRKSQCGWADKQPLVCCAQENKDTSILIDAENCLISSDVGADPDDGPGPGLALLPKQEECGPYSIDKIVGGTETDITDYPWTVLIGYITRSGTTRYYCGGSLINPRYVLTATHCFRGRSIPRELRAATIRLGEWDRATEIDCQETVCNDPPVDIPIQSIIVHSRYRPGSLNQLHDIALVRMATSVQYSRWIQPGCLPAISDEVSMKDFVDEDLYVSGWGRSEESSLADVKLQVRVPVAREEDCKKLFQTVGLNISHSFQMCAGGRRGQDSCSGDSGGPIMSSETTHRRTNWYIVGISSFGTSPCAKTGWPGVYTRVSAYNNWITHNIKE